MEEIDRKAVLSLLPHPITKDGAVVESVLVRPDETVAELLARQEITAEMPIAVRLDGEYISKADWDARVIHDGAVVEIRGVAEGGSSSGGGKVLRTVAMIVVAIVAWYVAAPLATAVGFGGSTIAQGVAASLVTIVGGQLVNALLPAANSSADQYSTSDSSTSSTYSIGPASNNARCYEPMLIVFGTHKVVPDIGCRPYTEVLNNDMYLLQCFHFGLQPDLDIANIKIGNTKLSYYDDVEIEFSGPDGKLSLLHGNMDTEDGQDLKVESDEDLLWWTRTTAKDTERIYFDFAGVAYKVNSTTGEAYYPNPLIQDPDVLLGDKIEKIVSPVIARIQYREVGTEEWKPMMSSDFQSLATHYWSLGYDVQDVNDPYDSANGGDAGATGSTGGDDGDGDGDGGGDGAD
jgi:sulfur carrier protein ThiS